MVDFTDIKEGDTVSWNGPNRRVSGKVETVNGKYIVRLPDGHSFRLEDFLNSMSFRIEEEE